MHKIKVLRLVSRMNVGGPAIQITGLLNTLSPSEFEQKLVIGVCEKDEVDYLEFNQINLNCSKIDGFGRSINFLADLKAFFAIRKEIITFSPDIIHTHTAKAGFLGRIAAISCFERQIRVHTFHGHLLKGYFGGIKSRLVIWTERILALYTDHLVAVGFQVRDELLSKKIGSYEKYSVIGPGLELGELPERESSLKSLGIREGRFIVTWIGRAVKVKAPHRILEIAKECKKRDLNLEFVVVGDGPLLNELKTTSELLGLSINFLGWQSHIEKILSFSDLVILTSLNEGTPVALIQAQMAGVPVLATDVGSASEVMIDGRSGFCLKYSIKDFADRIELLAKDRVLRSDFGVRGKSHAEAQFSLSQLVSKHAELYNYLLNPVLYPKLQHKHRPNYGV